MAGKQTSTNRAAPEIASASRAEIWQDASVGNSTVGPTSTAMPDGAIMRPTINHTSVIGPVYNGATATMAREIDGPPPAGHNRPAPMTPAEVQEYLDDTCADLRTRKAEIAAGIERFLEQYATIPNDDIYGRAGDFAGGKGAIAAHLKVAKARHDIEKQPHLRAGQATDGWFRSHTADIEAGRKLILERMTTYAMQREAAARQKAAAEAQEAQQRAEEAAATASTADEMDAAIQHAQRAEEAQRTATASVAELTRMTGAAGVTVSLRSTWKFVEEESDLMALVVAVAAGEAPLHYLAFNTVRINQAVRSDKVRAVRGCVIREERTIV